MHSLVNAHSVHTLHCTAMGTQSEAGQDHFQFGSSNERKRKERAPWPCNYCLSRFLNNYSTIIESIEAPFEALATVNGSQLGLTHVPGTSKLEVELF